MEQDLIRDYQNGMKWNDLCSKYKVSTYRIHKILHKNGIIPQRDFSWSKGKQELLRDMYLRNCTYSEMREALNSKDATINYWVKKLGLPMRGSGRNNVYNNPFLEQSPERDYWLGYLFADGHIGQNHIELTSKEESVVEAFNKFCGGICRIYKRPYTIKSGEVRIMYRCYIQSVDLYRWFKNTYKIDSKKHHTLNPDIEINWDILRGYFDGDGNAHKNGGWTITSCSKAWIDRCQKFLSDNDIRSTINTYKNCYKLSVWTIKHLHRLVPLLYQSGTFYLQYKYDRLEPYMSNHIVKTE